MRLEFRPLDRETFRSLRVRNFRLFFSGQLVSQIGNWLTLVGQALLVLKLTDSGVALGVLAAAQFGPLMAFGAFTGLLADRSDKRKLLLFVQSFAMVQSFCLAGLAFMDRPPLAAIYAVAFLGGLAVAVDNPARRSFVVEIVQPEDINNAVSLNSALMTAARVVGAALAGLLVTSVGFGWLFLLDGLSYLAVLAGLWLIDPSGLRQAPLTPRGKRQVREGLRHARSVPELWVPLVMTAVIGTLAFNFQTVFPLFAIRDLGGSDITFTWLMSIVSLGSLFGALVTARRTTVSVHTVSGAAVAFGMSMALLSVAANQVVAFALALLVGLASISFITASTAMMQIYSDPSMRGRVLALQAIVFLGTTPVGGPIVGAVSEHFGARYGLALGAVATIATGAFGLVMVRGHQRASSPYPPTPGDVGLITRPRQRWVE